MIPREKQDKINEYQRARYAANKERYAAYGAKWHEKNKEKQHKLHKEYRQVNKEKESARTTAWRKENPEKVREAQRRHGKKIRSTIMGRITENISSEISRSMKRGPRGRAHWEMLVGYTKTQLKTHLEKRFKPGMTWENYGEWHIDHKIPLAAFNIKTTADIDFKRAWALSNLQPLMALENMKKHAKTEKPFQPSLAIGAR